MKILIPVLVFILLFLISGCTEKLVYIKTPCPQMQTWEVEPLGNINYEVIYEEENNTSR